MNQEGDAPTRVTRAALRRRSVDQEATPQKPTSAATNGTPKKSASTTKKAVALNAIQETESRPATPVGGRSTRRRISESVDTVPTSVPNKLVQTLKETESNTGRRSRNSSLTEENLNALNSVYEGDSATLHPRTPARLRASHEALASSPQTSVPSLRRSTRRNSVTSDDGNNSVQSLPVTTPKMTAGFRALKDEAIIEEDVADECAESASSEASAKSGRRRQSTATVKAASVSPRSTPSSPALSALDVSTPPRINKVLKVGISPLQLPKMSPRSKNVSFSEDSKQEDTSSTFPKTPTSITAPREMFVVVKDLRNSELMGSAMKVDDGTLLPTKLDIKEKVVEQQEQTVDKSSKSDATTQEEAVDQTAKSIPLSSPNTSTTTSETNGAIEISETNEGRNAQEGDRHEMSGIEVLDASVVEIPDTSSNIGNTSVVQEGLHSRSWSTSVRGSATKGIDAFSIRKQEEEKRLENEKEQLDVSLKKKATPIKTPAKADDEDDGVKHTDDEDEDDVQGDKNEFIDDEALEMDCYESGDSMASNLRKEMEDNEIPEQGEDLGSEDTEEEDDDYENDDNDSWVVPDDEELDEDKLLAGSDDDLTDDVDDDKNEDDVEEGNKKKATPRRRIIEMVDDSEDEPDPVNVSLLQSPKTVSSSRHSVQSPTPVVMEVVSSETKSDQTPTVQPNTTVTPSKQNVDSGKTPDKKGQGSTPKQKTPSKVVEAVTAMVTPSKTSVSDTQETDEAVENMIREGSVELFYDATEYERKVEDQVKEIEELAKTPQKERDVGSRKSLPAGESKASLAATIPTRKSLPGNAKVQVEETKSHAEELVTDSVKPVATESNDEQDESKEQSNNVDVEQEKTVDVEQEKTADEEKVQSKQNIPEESQESPVKSTPTAEVITDRKSMPTVSMISAQFYLGGTKKRNTIAETNISTSTPHSKPAGKKGKKSAEEKASIVVPNPFALATVSKTKSSRLSLDSGSAAAQPKAKKSRLSLPSEFIETDVPKEDGAKREERKSGEGTSTQQDEPEPMEVDEEEQQDEKHGVDGDDTDDDSDDDSNEDGDISVEEMVTIDDEQAAAPKVAPKPKVKALEDFNLENILSRCNEFVREDKERKKKHASIFRKKKEEKKRLRELEEQQEREAAQAAVAAATAANGDVNANNSTSNDSTGQGNEPSKKKKRKPKVKNYVLEELADTKKERLEKALRHKLEVIERRKQRRKERLLEKNNQQVDKENGNGAVSHSGPTHGIGAKLEKLKKKKQQNANTKPQQQPAVRVALSAYAVFNQLQNMPAQQAQSALDGAAGGGLPEEKKKLATPNKSAIIEKKTSTMEEPVKEKSAGSPKKQESNVKPEQQQKQKVAQVEGMKENKQAVGLSVDSKQTNEPKEGKQPNSPTKAKQQKQKQKVAQVEGEKENKPAVVLAVDTKQTNEPEEAKQPNPPTKAKQQKQKQKVAQVEVENETKPAVVVLAVNTKQTNEPPGDVKQPNSPTKVKQSEKKKAKQISVEDQVPKVAAPSTIGGKALSANDVLKNDLKKDEEVVADLTPRNNHQLLSKKQTIPTEIKKSASDGLLEECEKKLSKKQKRKLASASPIAPDSTNIVPEKVVESQQSNSTKLENRNEPNQPIKGAAKLQFPAGDEILVKEKKTKKEKIQKKMVDSLVADITSPPPPENKKNKKKESNMKNGAPQTGNKDACISEARHEIQEDSKEVKAKKKGLKKAAIGTEQEAPRETDKKESNMKNGQPLTASESAWLAQALREIQEDSKEVKAKKKGLKKTTIDTEEEPRQSGYRNKLTAVEETPVEEAAITAAPTKKRKREPQVDGSLASTPRPAKHTKLRVLQRIESAAAGFIEETVTPDKVRVKRNFGFQESHVTPAKPVGFRVSSILSNEHDDLRAMASGGKTHTAVGRSKQKCLPEANHSLPHPVWTSSGVFFESDGDGGETAGKRKKQLQQQMKSSSTAANNTGYIQLKAEGGSSSQFHLKALRPGKVADKPHRIDPATVEPSVLSFKRQQLLEKTVHLREKKKGRRV